MMKLTAFSFGWLLFISVASNAQSAMISQEARIQQRLPENLYAQRRMPVPNPAIQDAAIRRQRELEDWDRDPRNPRNQDPELRTMPRAEDQIAFYNKRALEFLDKKDFPKALSYVNRALELCHICYWSYTNRASIKHASRDFTGAMADFDLSLRIRKSATAYHNRGYLKRDMNDLAGALDDFNRAIAMEATSVSYIQRARTKHRMNDRAGAIQDYRQAAKMYEQQRDTAMYQITVNELKAMNATP
jgi:tetratricopeptide (TPR) repeat protein